MGFACIQVLSGGPLAFGWLAGFCTALALSGVAVTTAFVGFVWHTPRRWTFFLTAMLIFVGSYAFTFAFTLIVAMTFASFL